MSELSLVSSATADGEYSHSNALANSARLALPRRAAGGGPAATNPATVRLFRGQSWIPWCSETVMRTVRSSLKAARFSLGMGPSLRYACPAGWAEHVGNHLNASGVAPQAPLHGRTT